MDRICASEFCSPNFLFPLLWKMNFFGCKLFLRNCFLVGKYFLICPKQDTLLHSHGLPFSPVPTDISPLGVSLMTPCTYFRTQHRHTLFWKLPEQPRLDSGLLFGAFKVPPPEHNTGVIFCYLTVSLIWAWKCQEWCSASQSPLNFQLSNKCLSNEYMSGCRMYFKFSWRDMLWHHKVFC